MCSDIDLMVWVDKKPGNMHSFEKFHERISKGRVLPYMMPGRHEIKRTATSDPKSDPVFT